MLSIRFDAAAVAAMLSLPLAPSVALEASEPRSTEAAEQYQRGGGGGWVDRLIERAFRDVLRREPDDSEYRRYRVRVSEDHWTEEDVRADLKGRRDYWSHRDRSDRERGSYDVDRVIRRAYEDVLGREPDQPGLREYRRKMIDEGWTERQVREALRKSPEHSSNTSASADRIVRRAYQDVLGREPDFNGLAQYRNQILSHGWDEHDVRQALLQSPEYRQKNAMTPDKAREVVRRAYLSVLGREPDPGSEGYVQRVLRDHWTEREVARELRNSPEYRNR